MNDMKRDLIRIQELVGMAFSETGSLVALADGGQMSPNKLQKTLEKTMEQFERTTLELRRLCERYSPGAGGFAHRPALPYMDITGSVETFGYGWLHITLHTLLPHCRYQTPNWLSDTIRCLLDEYETCGKKLPFYSRAMLVIDEHTGIEGRHIYDQDNKGWKAISNAIKGRLIPDDDQHKMINRCECVILLNTGNAISRMKKYEDLQRDTTFSPWIYSELICSSLIQQRRPERHSSQGMQGTQNFDAVNESLQIAYEVPTKHLLPLDPKTLSAWKAAYVGNKLHPLDVLYNQFPQIQKNILNG